MNVKDLILAELPTTDDSNTTNAITKPRRKYTKPVTEWEVVMNDACDGAIRRKTAKTSRLLVLLMSKGQFYIKDEISDEIEILGDENLAKFLAGSDCINNVVPWCKSIGGGKRKDAAEFVRLVNDENFQWLARRGLHSFTYTLNEWHNGYYEIKRKRDSFDSPIQKMLNKIGEEFVGHERWTELTAGCTTQNDVERKLLSFKSSNTVSDIKEMIDKFGIDWTRDFLRAFVNAPYVGTTIPTWWRMRSLFNVCKFDNTSLREYLFGESVRQGFGIVDNDWRNRDNIDRFVNLWSDTLAMQVTLRGKVYDKYPDDLPGLHQRLSFRCALRSISIDETMFMVHSKRIAENEYKDDKYLIRVPRNKEDMLDEASQQANCLASYVKAYSNDETDIYFMRSVEDPDKSLVTVEVRDGRIRQAYRACNRTPSKEEIEWLDEWAAKLGIIGVNGGQHPMCA